MHFSLNPLLTPLFHFRLPVLVYVHFLFYRILWITALVTLLLLCFAAQQNYLIQWLHSKGNYKRLCLLGNLLSQMYYAQFFPTAIRSRPVWIIDSSLWCQSLNIEQQNCGNNNKKEGENKKLLWKNAKHMLWLVLLIELGGKKALSKQHFPSPPQPPVRWNYYCSATFFFFFFLFVNSGHVFTYLEPSSQTY